MKNFQWILFISAALCAQLLYADASVSVNLLNPEKKPIGMVTFKESPYGLIITPALSSLPPGLHGFHIHDHPSCDDAGMAALGHLDPQQHKAHLGPYNNNGHLGDLPVLYVDNSGNAATATLAPRLKLADIYNHALMIHEGPDSYTDHPPMGGGAARIACGIIKK